MFDKVFKPSCTQEEVYTSGAKPIVGGELKAFNRHITFRSLSYKKYFDSFESVGQTVVFGNFIVLRIERK